MALMLMLCLSCIWLVYGESVPKAKPYDSDISHTILFSKQ